MSVVTLGELRAGVLATGDGLVRARRLRTLSAAMELDPIPIDDTVATAWAERRVALRDAGRHMGLNDSWIAATALALQVPVVTQDAGFVEVGDSGSFRCDAAASQPRSRRTTTATT